MSCGCSSNQRNLPLSYKKDNNRLIQMSQSNRQGNHGFLKVRVSGFLYTDFADPTDFFRFSQRVRVVRAIRVQKLVFVKR